MNTDLERLDDIEPISRRAHYPEATIMAGLGELVVHHSSVKASNALAEAGMKITPTTLKSWRQRYPRRYAALSKRYTAALEGILTAETKDNALIGARVAKKALRLEEQRIDDADVRDAAGSFRNISIGLGVNLDKAMQLEGRPTAVVEHRRDVSDIVASINQLVPGAVVEGEAVEIEQGEQRGDED